jgi:NCS1 family nucleobase:cation symporter-1
VRRTELAVEDLYRVDGAYAYRGGFNPVAIVALVVGVLPNVPGFLGTVGAVEGVSAFWMDLYGYAWFTGFLIAGGAYLVLSKVSRKA